jgi:hypothetical protein
MAISDPRFAAQIRMGAGRRVEHFDDVGCALAWLDALGDDAPLAQEIWVRDARGDAWLDARSAHYEAGHTTPMGYGFAALPDAGEGARDLEEVRKAIREQEDERRAGR